MGKYKLSSLISENKWQLNEGTRAMVAYLDGDKLITTYNHYDGYPENLGKGLEAHYNDDEKARDVANRGYITYLDPETGDIDATHDDPAREVNLPSEDEDMARAIAGEIDNMYANYGYIWDDRVDRWVTIENNGINSMIDQIMKEMGDYSMDEAKEKDFDRDGDIDYETDGYVESMGPLFHKGLNLLIKAWEEWKTGPMTEPGMIPYAKRDVLNYLKTQFFEENLEEAQEKDQEPRDGVKSAAAKLGIKPSHVKESFSASIDHVYNLLRIKKEIRFHLNAYKAGTIDGDDLAQAVEEVVYANEPYIKEQGMFIDDDEWEKEMGRTPEDTEKAIDKELSKIKGEKEIEEGISKDDIKKALKGTKVEIETYMDSLKRSGDKFDSIEDYVEDFENYVADKALQEHFGRFLKDYQ